MPLFDYECRDCGEIFEVVVVGRDGRPECPACGGRKTRKLPSVVAVHVRTDTATPRIEKRVKDYLKDGKFKEATRFADKAAAMTKNDKAKRIAAKLHEKTGD